MPMTCPVLGLGISPCPNDTYIFDALVNRRIAAPFDVAPHMADVEELNSLAREGRLTVTKLSLAAAGHVLDRYVLLNAGGALGRGCGPLLVSRPELASGDRAGASVAIPGRMTTANLLLSLTGQFRGPREEMIFDQVMPAVERGETGLGLIIHEGRFTYEQRGLRLVLDLGQWWEENMGLPLPLGVIAVRRDLGPETALLVEEAIRQSLLHARAHPQDGREFIRTHAQEMDEQVMADHIATFVNDFSLDLGEEGRNAIMALFRAGAEHAGYPALTLPVFAE